MIFLVKTFLVVLVKVVILIREIIISPHGIIDNKYLPNMHGERTQKHLSEGGGALGIDKINSDITYDNRGQKLVYDQLQFHKDPCT